MPGQLQATWDSRCVLLTERGQVVPAFASREADMPMWSLPMTYLHGDEQRPLVLRLAVDETQTWLEVTDAGVAAFQPVPGATLRPRQPLGLDDWQWGPPFTVGMMAVAWQQVAPGTLVVVRVAVQAVGDVQEVMETNVVVP